MKEIIEKYLKWKDGRDEDYVYDEIHDFISELDRGQLVEVFECLSATTVKNDPNDKRENLF